MATTTALGAIEIISIPKGMEAADAMLKAANVQLVTAATACPGKYVVVVFGEVAEVNASVQAGKTVAKEKTIDSLVIPNVHEQVMPAIHACSSVDKVDAIGTEELFSVCGAIEAADAAAKAATVDLIEVRLARGLGGKSFFVLTGDVASVRAGIEAGRAVCERRGLVSDCVVIPSPHPELIKAIL